LLEETGDAIADRTRGGLLAWPADWRPKPADLVPGRCLAVLTHGRRTLELHFVGQFGPDELLLRVVAVDGATTEDLLRKRLGLTAREAEVLLWLSRGKSNRDIADILDMRSGTVTKHLEQIYIKLGVENRASAATMALRVVADDGPETQHVTTTLAVGPRIK
jgi:DNA-binding CsgD family transcriptional regulator